MSLFEALSRVTASARVEMPKCFSTESITRARRSPVCRPFTSRNIIVRCSKNGTTSGSVSLIQWAVRVTMPAMPKDVHASDVKEIRLETSCSTVFISSMASGASFSTMRSRIASALVRSLAASLRQMRSTSRKASLSARRNGWSSDTMRRQTASIRRSLV